MHADSSASTNTVLLLSRIKKVAYYTFLASRLRECHTTINFDEFLFGDSNIFETLLAVPVMPPDFGLGSDAARVLTPHDGTYGALMLARRCLVRKIKKSSTLWLKKSARHPSFISVFFFLFLKDESD
jgi:hypothetical protein